MTKTLTAALIALIAQMLPLAAQADCVGQNLIAAMEAEPRAAFEARDDAIPHAEGLMFRATRGDQQITLIGTYHLSDPRHAALSERARPALEGARALLVEAGPDEEAALQQAILSDPGLSFVLDGPTLPERLPGDEWQALSAALSARGIPAPLAAKSQPWMVAMTLGLSPCQTAELRDGGRGLDQALIDAAGAAGLPIVAVEPYDTVFSIFDDLTPEEELELIRISMAAEPKIDDFSATVADEYFAGRPWLIWEFSRVNAYDTLSMTPAEVDAEFDDMQEVMVDARNRDWIDDIEREAAIGPIVVAVGALHLPGDAGVLRLLEAQGWAVERLH